MPINPQILPSSPLGRTADTLAEVKRRLAVLERGSAGGISSNGTGALHVGDAAGGDLAGTYPDPTVPGVLRTSLFLAKGDILVATGPNTAVRLPVGADGTVLTADASEPTGVRWDLPSAPPGSEFAISNVITDRTFNANATNLDELADVLGTVIGDLPLPLPSYTLSNVTTDRAFDANATSLDELADVLGTVINDLLAAGGTYTITNVTTLRTMDANAVTIDQYADVLGTLINDLVISGDL